jgi:hypothetical protein
MGQLYIQRFEYRGAVSKSEFDQAWSAAMQRAVILAVLGTVCVTLRLTEPAGAGTH